MPGGCLSSPARSRTACGCRRGCAGTPCARARRSGRSDPRSSDTPASFRCRTHDTAAQQGMIAPLSRTPLSVHLILLAGQICFASLPVVGRLAVGHIPPAGIVVVRMTGGALVFSVIAWQRDKLKLQQRGDLPMIVLCAVLGTVRKQGMFRQGLASP